MITKAKQAPVLEIEQRISHEDWQAKTVYERRRIRRSLERRGLTHFDNGESLIVVPIQEEGYPEDRSFGPAKMKAFHCGYELHIEDCRFRNSNSIRFQVDADDLETAQQIVAEFVDFIHENGLKF